MSSMPPSAAITPTVLRHLPHDEGETHPVMGDPMRFIMTAEHTAGRYAISEFETRPGSGAPPHIHHREDETFYVLEGTVQVTVDGQEYQLHQGDCVHVPCGAVRGFVNTTDRNVRLLIYHCPGSAADFYIGMGKLSVPPRLEDIKALGDQYGIEIVGPGAGAE